MIRVAAGALRRASGDVLIAQRPPGKIAAGQWEFPGGKIEAGESAYEALCRELHEELHVEVLAARPLIGLTHAYADRTVHLDTWLVTEWRGTPHGREGQELAWSAPAKLGEWALLEADGPIVDALQLPSLLAVSVSHDSAEAAIEWAERALAAGAGMLRLRAAGSAADDYRHLCETFCERRPDLASRTQVDCPDLARAGGWAGCHLSAGSLLGLKNPPERGTARWWSGSIHDERELGHLCALGLDFAVAGHVNATASHPGQPGRGWDWLRSVTSRANRPVYAIGGLGPTDARQAWQHGAQGVAAISAFQLGG